MQRILLIIGISLIVVKVDCAVDSKVATSGYFGLQDDKNFGHSGYVVLSSDPTPPAIGISKCQYYDVNKTICNLMSSMPLNSTDVILLKIWTAITLRDNIVTVLGVLVHLKSNIFPHDLYTSLYFLYREVQRRNIKTMELLPSLRAIAAENGVNRLITLFKELPKVMPAYCKAAVEEATKSLTRMKDKLVNVFGSEVTGRGVDVLQDLDSFLIPALRTKTATTANYDKSIEASFGKEFAVFYAGITKGQIGFTQPVLAALMLSLKYNAMRPDFVENLRYLGDILRDNRIKNWRPDVKFGNGTKDPYAMVRSALSELASFPDLDNQVADAVNQLVPKIVKFVDTSANPEYYEMVPFFATPELNFTFLLDRMAVEGATKELAFLRQSITNEKVDTNFALKGFIRYDYGFPHALFVALLNRMKNRVPMSQGLRKDMRTILAHPSLTFSKEEHDVTKRSSMDQGMEGRVMAILSKDNIDWNVLLDARPFNLCESPRKCLDDLLNTVLGGVPGNATSPRVPSATGRHNVTLCPKSDVGTPISVWLQDLSSPAPNSFSSELMDGVSSILGNVTTNGSDIFAQIQRLTQGKTYATKKDLLSDVLKNMLTLKRVQATPVVYYEAIRLLCVLVHNTSMRMNKLLNDDCLDAPPPVNLSGNMLGNASLPISKLLNDTAFMRNLSGIKPEDYLSKRLLLIALFKRMLTFESIKKEPGLYDEVIRLLHSIQTLIIRFDELVKALVIESISEGEWSNCIIGFLSQPNLFTILGEEFNIGLYHSKGMLLKAILEKALNVTIVKSDSQLYHAIEAMVHKVACGHHGAEAVDTVHGEGIMSYSIDFYKLMDSAIDKSKVTNEVEESFENMYNWYEGTFHPLRYVANLNMTLYDTRAEVLNGFFDNVAKSIDIDAAKMRKDIERMRSAILTTGSGAEPVDYV